MLMIPMRVFRGGPADGSAWWRIFSRNVIAFDQICRTWCIGGPKNDGIAMTDKELAAGGIGVSRARHRNNAANVSVIIEFSINLVARIATAPASFRQRDPWSAGRRPGS